ncbi:GL10987 [Drosophila persimilis]|uniref:GL10987 n=1 Tax=Drosophila persimilis TaxID=7234 RepID=B4HA86_DROPE|nr:GL10987 [Drosophila persimilis]
MELERNSEAYEILLTNFALPRKSRESTIEPKELELQVVTAQSDRSKDALETVEDGLKRLQQQVADSEEEGSMSIWHMTSSGR